MTQREMLNAIVAGAVVTAEMETKAKEMLTALDKKNENRSAKSTENANANLALAKEIIALMGDRTWGASEIVTLCANNNIDVKNTSKVGAVFKVAIENGLLTAIDNFKVGGKGRGVKGYRVV